MPLSILVVLLLLCVSPAAARESQTPPQTVTPESFTIPAEAVHKVNPAKPTAASIAQRKKYYRCDCGMCHGNNGDGKGEVAIDGKLKIGALNGEETFKNNTDGEQFYVIRNGHGQMPPERIRSSPNELWNLGNYVRLLPNKKG
jgi:cytochrome c